jgi:hypothetical protein
MGKAKILEAKENGLFKVEIDAGKAERDARVALVNAKLVKLNVEIAELTEKRDEAQLAVDGFKAQLESLINQLSGILQQDSPSLFESTQVAVQFTLEQGLKAGGELAALEAELKILEANRAAMVVEKSTLQALPLVTERDVWCVDFTEEAEQGQEVATIEVIYEPQAVLIAPGARAHTAEDGKLVARGLMTPEQVFLNAAILPGVQRWRPEYRKATILQLDATNNTATVELDEAVSTAQNLGLDPPQEKGTLIRENVPVEYMTCNAAAFRVDDRVIVQFNRSWDQSRVIGFVDNPRSCLWPCVYATAFYYYHVFECADADLLAEIAVTSGISVEYRLNRGQWISMQYIQTITASGGRLFYQWANPSPSVFDQPIVEIGYNFSLSVGFDPGAPKVNGLSFYPANTNSGGAVAIAELRIRRNGEVKMNCAFRWNPSDFDPTFTEVRGTGGIAIKAQSIEVRLLEDYVLFVEDET